MDSSVQNELLLLMGVDNLVGEEVFKSMSICANILNDTSYIAQVNDKFGELFKTPDFDLLVELSQLITVLLKVNNNFSYYKEIAFGRMKYVVYATIYAYIAKNQLSEINRIGAHTFRILFTNLWSVLEVVPESVKIAKAACFSCFGSTKRTVGM